MGFTLDQYRRPVYNNDITDPVGQFQAAVDFAANDGPYRSDTTAKRLSTNVPVGTSWFDTDLEILFTKTASAWSAVDFPGMTKTRQFVFQATAPVGQATIHTFTPQVRKHPRRCLIRVSGTAGGISATGYGAIYFEATSGVTFANDAGGGGANGGWFQAGQFAPIGRTVIADIAANATPTITAKVDQSQPNTQYKVTVSYEFLGTGEYNA